MSGKAPNFCAKIPQRALEQLAALIERTGYTKTQWLLLKIDQDYRREFPDDKGAAGS